MKTLINLHIKYDSELNLKHLEFNIKMLYSMESSITFTIDEWCDYLKSK